MTDKGCILIVDDEDDIRFFLAIMLKREGYKVIEAADGFECIKKVKESKPDLVILDIMMPDMDGWEVCKKIKEINPKLPVAMLTAKTGETYEVKSLISGASSHISKPMKKEEILGIVQDLLGRFKTH